MHGLHTRFVKFARELYRRRVPRVAAAYVVAGAAAVNVANLLEDIFALPDYTTRLVLALLIVGLPVAIALAWALDITPAGIVRTPAEPDLRPRLVTKPTRRRNLTAVALALAAVAVGVLTTVRFWGGDTHWRPDEPVAVIPSVRGVDGEDAVAVALATLLATRLESAGWSTVDLDRLREDLGLVSYLEPAAFAGRVGAGSFVDLRLDVAGDTAVIRADLFAVDDPGDVLKTARDTGSLADVMKAIDRIAVGLTGDSHGLLDPFQMDPPRSDPAAVRVAIMPVEVQGPEQHAYLRDAVAMVLGAKLEQAGWPTSDSRSLFGVAEQLDGVQTRLAAAQVAARVYAAFYVRTTITIADTGSVLGRRRWPWQAHPEIRAESRLFNVRGETPIASVSAEGRLADLVHVVGELADGITRAMHIEDRNAPVADDAPTASPAALEAFISGARQFREGRYSESMASFERAIQADRWFAIAYYRLSIAAEWTEDVGGSDPLEWKERGTRLAIQRDRCGRAEEGDAGAPGSFSCPATDNSRRLTWRTRLLAEARLSQQAGAIEEAERLYNWILSAYPDDYEATLQLGEILFHYAPLEGRDALESDSLWQRLLNFRKSDYPALLHSARLDALANRVRELEGIAESALETDPDRERRLEMEAYVAFTRRDPDRIRTSLQALAEWPEARTIWTIAGRVAMFTRNLSGAEQIARLLTNDSRPVAARVLGHVTLAHLLAAQGRWNATRMELARVRALDPLTALIFEASLMSSAFGPERPRAELEDLRELLLANAPQPPGEAPVNELTVHDSVYDRLWRYSLGMLSLRLGRESEAERYVTQISALGGSDDAVALGGELARSLRAQIAVSRGNFIAAEQEMEGARIRTAASKITLSPFFAQTAQRFLHAQILAYRNRVSEAMSLFASFGEVSVFDLAYLAPAHFERARLFEEQGDPLSAAREYEQVIRLWQNPDRELLPLVERAREYVRAIGAGD